MENSNNKVIEIARELIIERCLAHGLPHIVDSKKSVWIRIFWGFLLFISLGFYFYYLFLISFKFFTNPDILLNYGSRLMNELPFPAVTICGPTFIHKSNITQDVKLDFFLEYSDQFSPEVVDFLASSQWYQIDFSLKALNLTKNQPKKRNIMEIMRKSQLSLDEFMFNCSYKNKPVECSQLFTQVITEFGICFTYNMVNPEEFSESRNRENAQSYQWTIDDGYKSNSEGVKPRRASKKEEIVVGLKHPEKVLKSFDIDRQYIYFLHQPNELNLESQKNAVYYNTDRVLAISAKSLRTKKEVLKYPPDVRKCYLEGEKKLKFYEKYTEYLCKMECLTNRTFEECNCVKFSMPHDENTKICSIYEDVKCMIDVKKSWMRENVKCGCLASCNSIQYFLSNSKENKIYESINSENKPTQLPENFASQLKIIISKHEVEEELKVCSIDSTNYITSLAGLTSLFTGCSIVSILELVFFIITRRRRSRRENTGVNSLDEFVQSSSIEGAKCFHSSESKFVKIFWIFIFFLTFCALGFYFSEMYSKIKLHPRILNETSEISMQEIPLPAVTLCIPIFSNSLSLNEFVKNPEMKLTFEQQNEMAANLESCSPELAAKYAQYLPMANSNLTISFMKAKNPNIEEIFAGCFFKFSDRSVRTVCTRILNYVLTDYGFCYTFNLEGFPTLFNTEVISDDFKCYKRDKLVKNFNISHPEFEEPLTDENQPIDWTLEKGYLSNLRDVSPVRAKTRNFLQLRLQLFNELNLCQERGTHFTFFFHMPNEILTPFHKPYIMNIGIIFFLHYKYFKTDESLRPYQPVERGCYFEGERALKFFKSYTKAHCEFECLTNFTLDVCGCVKFSMPRENSTPICGINQISCYVEAMRNWSSNDESNCGCLNPCTYIEYGYDHDLRIYDKCPPFDMNVRNIFVTKFVRLTYYGLESGLADFGGMLGIFFGASVISFIEIFYFCFIALIKKKFNIQVDVSGSSDSSTGSSNIQDISECAKESTFHGFQFIFKNSLRLIFRSFWIITFLFTLTFILYYTRGNFLKLTIHPEKGTMISQKPIEDIPFPAITIDPILISKFNNSVDSAVKNFPMSYHKDEGFISKLSEDLFYTLIANQYWWEPEFVHLYLQARSKFFHNATDPFNYQYNVDLFPYFEKSHMEIDEYFFRCELSGEEVDCKKIIKRVITKKGMGYTFNMQNFHNIFKKDVSKNFDSYGRYEGEKVSQWSLDQGFRVKKPTNPMRASIDFEISLFLKMSKIDASKYLFRYFHIHLPNEITTSTYKRYFLNQISKLSADLSAVVTRADESLRNFKPENRGCYFENERKLQFFNTYTQSNCEIECLTNLTLQACNCVPYHLIHNNSTKTCSSANDGECYCKVLKDFPPLNYSTPCGCLKTCNNIEYVVLNQKESWNHTFYQHMELHKTHFLSQLIVRFSSLSYTEDMIFVSYGFLNFITDLGGLLGLFLGCSMLSFFELIYYPTKFLIEKVKKKNQMRKNLVSLDVKVIQEINRDLTSKDENETKNEKEGKETKENQEIAQVSVEIEHFDTREGKNENSEVKNVEEKEENLELSEQEKEDKKINKTEEEKNSNEEKTEITQKVEEIEAKKTKLAKKDSENQNPAKDEEVEKTESSLSMEEIEHQNFLKLLDEVEKEFSVIPGTLDGDNDSISTLKTI